MLEQIIADRYRIESKLGEGGMGTVFLGTDLTNQQPVAIKQLKQDIAEPELIERFKREGEALRELNHPNMVKMLDSIEQNDQHYLVMEYISGGDLAGILRRGKLPVDRILNIAIDLADALTRAHKLNIIHRDLKPANVLIGEDGILRLTDFGVAHVGSKERVTETGSVVGTFDYLPPEAFIDSTFDARGDIWAFGIMLFEMVAGQRPFQADSVGKLMVSIMQNPLPDLESLAPDAPVALVDLIYRMLERDKQMRVPSVRIVGAELEAILQGGEAIMHVEQRFNTPLTSKELVAKHNLPYQTTEFVGREVELHEVSNLLMQPQNRLVTIVAQGGMGKTRLSIQTGLNHLEYFTDGVYWVELAPLSSAENIVATIAEATGYQFQSGTEDYKKQLLDYLSSKQMLLIMDNYEHLLDGAYIVADILKQAGNVKILVTSRQRLAVSGEVIYSLGGMELPDLYSIDDALGYPAIQLFIDCARRAKPDFELDSDNLTPVVKICRMVYGMPLGIVLASSWLSMLSPDEVAQELEQGMDILEDEIGELPERQRSIRAVMDYSWQQMSEAERTVFMKLSVFRGGFTREAAQSVADANLRVLMNLVNKSFLRRDTESGRYLIHELLRQYAFGVLQDSAQIDDVKLAHASYYAGLLEEQTPKLKGKDQFGAIALMDTERENLRSSWHVAVQDQREDLIAKMMNALNLHGTFRSWDTHARDAFTYIRQQWQVYQNLDKPIHAKLLIRFPNPSRDLLLDLEKAFTVAQAENDAPEMAYCQHQLGVLLAHQRSDMGGDNTTRGIEYLRSAIESYQAVGDDFYRAMAMDDLLWAIGTAGHFDRRAELAEQTEKLRREIGDYVGLARGSSGRSATQHKSAESIAILQEGLQLAQKLGDRYNVAWTNAMLGMRNCMTGRLDISTVHNQQAIELAKTYNFEEVYYFSQIVQIDVDLIAEKYEIAEFQERIDQLLAEGGKLIRERPAVNFGIIYLYLYFYMLKPDYESFERVLVEFLDFIGFGVMYMVWILPLLGTWHLERNPERAFVYYEVAFRYIEYGSGWFLNSSTHMNNYNTLKPVYTRAEYPELWQKIESITLEEVRQEVKSDINY